MQSDFKVTKIALLSAFTDGTNYEYIIKRFGFVNSPVPENFRLPNKCVALMS